MTNEHFIPMSSYLSGALGEAMGNFDNSLQSRGLGGIATFAAEGGGCSGCESGCSGGCSGTCSGGCSGGCKGTCKDTCKGTCNGGCKDACKGSCSANCTGNCSGSCSGGCETYCAGINQTYCNYEQTYSKNKGSNNPGGEVFTWTNSNTHGQTIKILAKDWNLLASYVEEAADYCASSSISISRVNSGDPITAAAFNSLDNGINKLSSAGSVGTKTKDVDIIKDEDINALATNYNKAQIKTGLPNNSSGEANKCCQNGMSCMTKASGRPSLQPCSQTKNYQCTTEQ